jgi:hypothetical protein
MEMLDNSCICKFGDGHHYACLPHDDHYPGTAKGLPESKQEPSFADFAYCLSDRSARSRNLYNRNVIVVQSDCLEESGCEGHQRFCASNEAVKSSAGKWIPIVQNNMVTHVAKVKKVSTIPELYFDNPAQQASPFWNLFQFSGAFYRIIDNQSLPKMSLDKKDLHALRQTCKDMQKATEQVPLTMFGGPRWGADQLPSFTTVTYSLHLEMEHLKEIQPPLPLPGSGEDDASPQIEMVVPFPSSICCYECELVSVEGSDIMGYNLHRGKQGGGNQTCMCPFCNATKSMIQKSNCKGSPGNPENFNNWHRLFEEIGLRRPAARNNVIRRALYVPKHSSPVPLHLMLGLTNTWRSVVKIVCQILDGENQKAMLKLKRQLERDLAKLKVELGTAQKQHKQSQQQFTALHTQLYRKYNMDLLTAASGSRPLGSALDHNQLCVAEKKVFDKEGGTMQAVAVVTNNIAGKEGALEKCEKQLVKGPTVLALKEFFQSKLQINEATFHGGKHWLRIIT